ncbi:MAG: DUF1178 family protein [Bauldia litoralis]
MIRYTLKCDQGHDFEAWFRNSATYDDQASAGEVRCPDCGSVKVSKALMAPAVARGRSSAPVVNTPQPPAPAPEPGDARVHYAGKVREMLVEMRRHIESNADYVGNKFADEARKIHSGEADERSIYGEATEDETEALKEEGIEFGQIPWVPKDDA